MANNVNISSYNEILGNMIRKIIADTPANDINRGSMLLTLLEAAAANDYENNTAILNVLELLNIDALQNNDLDAHASNLGLRRNTATKSSGFIKITDSSITKRSTSLYAVKPAPIVGSTVLHVSDATGWSNTGVLYLGRGTSNFEGPISYSSITDNVSFFTIQLVSALEKDHLLSDTVVDGQGTSNRQILAGTTVKTPASNISPEVRYVVLRDAVIPAGEDTVIDVPIVASLTGSTGNAGINSIILFNSLPFSGAKVTNTNALTNGKDTESDEQFKNRVKAYSSTLARGTKQSILSAIDGVSDETEGKQVTSAVITEPVSIGDPSIVYIDDGEGLQPSYLGQSVDLLIGSASGKEEFLQLANYPLPRPQIVNSAEAPFLFLEGFELKVAVDKIEESVIFTASDFKSLSTADISEVIIAINDRALTYQARLTADSTRILLYTMSHNAETIQVISDKSALDANVQLKFPVNEFSYISLYQNNNKLKEIQRPATITTSPFSTWGITGSGNLILSVDNTPDQDRSFNTSDFGGKNFNALTVSDYVTAFNAKFAGITASATSTGRMTIVSNKEGSASSIEAVGGTYLDKMFSGQVLSTVGQDSDFTLNRQNGNLQIKTTINVGDSISAGSSDTKGNVISNAASSGAFNVSTDTYNRSAEMVVVVDAKRVYPRKVNLSVGATLTLSNMGSNIMRMMASTANSFKEIQPNDYIYITNRGDIDGLGTGPWLDILSCGLFKVTAKGEHTSSGVDTYIEVVNDNMVVGGPYSVLDDLDFQAFYSDVYPQIWRGSMTPNPAVATISDVINSFKNNIEGINASIFRTNYIKLTSITEEGGSIAIPVSIASAAQLFIGGTSEQSGVSSHIANKVEEIDAISTFERTTPTNSNIWLDRYVYSDIKGGLTLAVEPSKDGTGTYSEVLTDTATASDFQLDIDYDNAISITTGQNKKQTRNIRTIVDADTLGTRHDLPRSILDYNIGDEYEIIKNLEFSPEDSLVAIIDNDSTAKTVDISFSRTGQINSGSQAGIFIPTNVAFSANDSDNEPGIDFGTLSVWGTLATQSSTNFNDYAIWMRARNWYVSNGASMIIRAKEYGPIGDKIRFQLEYPIIANAAATISHSNDPDVTLVTHVFASGAEEVTNVAPGDNLIISSLGGDNFRITFPVTATVTNTNVGDIISIIASSGFNAGNLGAFRINAKNDLARTIDIYNPNGVATTEILNVLSGMILFPITGTSTASIIAKINESEIISAVVVTAGTFIKATREENSIPVNQLGYGHDSSPGSGLNSFISLHDSKSWVLSFQNTNPNFQLKTALVLNGVSPAYVIDTVPNDDATFGEYFKLVPVTVTNIEHQLVHKALSQLDIIADVAISSAGKKIQLKSQQLGSVGAIEVVGGRANSAAFKILGDSQINTSNAVNYLEMKIPSSPNTLSPGQSVILQNGYGVERLNRQISSDTMNVVKVSDETFEYRFNAKSLNFDQYVKFTIVDANSVAPGSYPVPGVVWRWTHNDAGSQVTIEDVANGTVGAQPASNSPSGTLGGGTNAVVTVTSVGSVSTKLKFNIISTGQPVQADYYTFQNSAGVTYAAWMNIDSNGAVPTGASYLAATNKVQIDILSTDTPNQIMSAIISELLTFGIISDFNISISSAASLSTVREGNIINPIGVFTGWSNTNKGSQSGDGNIAGYPIVKVDASSKYMDVVNPNGKAMASTAIGTLSELVVSSSPIIEWKLAHSSLIVVDSVSINTGIATATTDGPHLLNVGDTFSTVDFISTAAPSVPGAGVGTVLSVIGANQFTYATAQPNALNITPVGFIIKVGKTRTRYKIESLGYNSLFRIKRVDGDSPKFISCGVAIDDLLLLSGTSFNSINSGEFRILGIDEDSIIYKNSNAVEELDTMISFNNLNISVNWTSNSDQVTGIAGSFTNVNIGDWVKKQTDNDTYYRQVIGLNAAPALATIVTLGSTYSGITATSVGHSLDQNSNIGTGVYLSNIADIQILEGDAVRVNDVLFVSENTSTNWFESVNSGTFTIDTIGTNETDGKIFLRVNNAAGVNESGIIHGTVNTRFSITEADANAFTTIKKIHHIAIDEVNPEKRTVYLSPGNRAYKWNQSNATSISALGKLGFSSDVVTGVDGYLYYTGLLRKVQRIIDGFEPDAINFPGRKAAGSLIEVLPPLPRRVTIALDVTTQDGVNLSEISDEITSAIINYVSDLGVGEDVILSDIIVRVKDIDGVLAVTFITPAPSQERIPISSNEKAFIKNEDISVA